MLAYSIPIYELFTVIPSPKRRWLTQGSLPRYTGLGILLIFVTSMEKTDGTIFPAIGL